MSRVSQAISDELLSYCQKELKEQGIRGETGRRLQAIISAKSHGISAVSEIYNISRETLMRWIRKVKAEGTQGFEVANGRGRKAKLAQEQKKEIKRYVEENGATLTAKILREHIHKTYSVYLSLSTAFRLLKTLGFSHISPRPIHFKKEEKAAEEFKKKSTTKS